MIARLLTLLLAAVISHSAFAIDAKPIKWSDLQPDSVSLRSTISHLNPEQKNRLMRAFQQRQQKAIVAASKLKPSEMSIDISTLLKEDFRDLQPLMAQIDSFEKKRTTEAVTSLDKQTIQLDGYLLPLKQDNKKVSEFILVPVVGACIHVPAPPANQMIIVQYPKGFAAGSMFSPITVTGKLTIKSSKSELYMVDGSSTIDVGYAMTATDVRNYKPAK